MKELTNKQLEIIKVNTADGDYGLLSKDEEGNYYIAYYGTRRNVEEYLYETYVISLNVQSPMELTSTTKCLDSAYYIYDHYKETNPGSAIQIYNTTLNEVVASHNYPDVIPRNETISIKTTAVRHITVSGITFTIDKLNRVKVIKSSISEEFIAGRPYAEYKAEIDLIAANIKEGL